MNVKLNLALSSSRRFKYLVKRNSSLVEELTALEVCPVCGLSKHLIERTSSKEPNIFSHLKHCHAEYVLNLFEEEESKKPIEEQGDECPLCGIRTTQMQSHVKNEHGLTWEEFISQTGFTGGKCVQTPNHRKQTSEKKYAYYRRPEGLEYKKLQSEMFKGDKNPACRPEVRDKISRSRLGQKSPRKTREVNSKKGAERLLNGENQLKSLGYFFKLIYNHRYYYARSFTEFKVLISLLENNIEFKQEPFRIEYYDSEEGINKYYVPDYVIGNNVFETKVSEKELNTSKYLGVKKAVESIGYSFNLLNRSNFKEVLGVYPLSGRQIDEFIKKNIDLNLLHIVAPETFNGSHALLIKLFGENFEEILKNNEEKFNENKKNLCI